ncbi:MAG: hypothetical protein U0163_02985 [Gemmatimonadaceae bacterium]
MSDQELDLLQGTLDVLVLRALSFGKVHGYGIARFLRQGSDGTFKILDGALYASAPPHGKTRGWVRSEWGISEGSGPSSMNAATSRRRALRASPSWDQYVAAVAKVMVARPGRLAMTTPRGTVAAVPGPAAQCGR